MLYALRVKPLDWMHKNRPNSANLKNNGSEVLRSSRVIDQIVKDGRSEAYAVSLVEVVKRKIPINGNWLEGIH